MMLSGLISLHVEINRSLASITRAPLGNNLGSSPVNDLLTVEIVACRRQLSGPEADTPLVDLALAFHMDCVRVNGIPTRYPKSGSVLYPLKEQRQAVLTPQIASEHEIQNEETVRVVLECVAHVHDERVVGLVWLKSVTGKPRNPEPNQSVI